jgi:hypothetical protein
MNIRLALRIGLEKFLHLLEGNCGIQEIVSVKKSKQVIEERQIHILNFNFLSSMRLSDPPNGLLFSYPASGN